MPANLNGNKHGTPGDGPPIVMHEFSEKLHVLDKDSKNYELGAKVLSC